MVCQAEYLPQRNCKSVIEALVMANNVDEETWDPIILEVIVVCTVAHGATRWTPTSGRHGASCVHPLAPLPPPVAYKGIAFDCKRNL